MWELEIKITSLKKLYNIYMITNSLNKNLGDTVLANRPPGKDVKESSPTAHFAGHLSEVKLNLLHKNGSSCKQCRSKVEIIGGG